MRPDPRALLGRRTFRWNDGDDASRYEAVEASADELVFFRWSHDHGAPTEGSGGRHDELRQRRDAFEDGGPARPMPATVERALRAFLAGLPG